MTGINVPLIIVLQDGHISFPLAQETQKWKCPHGINKISIPTIWQIRQVSFFFSFRTVWRRLTTETKKIISFHLYRMILLNLINDEPVTLCWKNTNHFYLLNLNFPSMSLPLPLEHHKLPEIKVDYI